MRSIFQNLVCCTAIVSAVGFFSITFAETTHFNKAQVGDRIRKVENGVDDFEKYLSTRGENAGNKAGSAKNSGGTNRRQGENAANKDARKDQAKQSKDDLQDAMDDLNRTTNRLRRKFDPMANYLETKVQMEQVMDSARRVNQVVAKNKNDSQVGRLWTALRASINDLARCYNITPMGG
ncbi:MAG TPA: hypothetical protein VGI60_14065 [Chthoniobacterales bacterium]|jgi:hypothetical protein